MKGWVALDAFSLHYCKLPSLGGMRRMYSRAGMVLQPMAGLNVPRMTQREHTHTHTHILSEDQSTECIL